MAVQTQFGGFTGCFPCGGNFADAEEQTRALRDYGTLLYSAAANGGYRCPVVVVSGAQSELTCNGSGVLPSSRKRGREADDRLNQYVAPSSALLPFPATQEATRVVDSAAASASGRTLSSAQHALVLSELCRRQGAEVDALVRAECERLRAGLEHERERRCRELARAVAGAAARRLREKEAELEAARRRAAELEERLRRAAAESQAWCGLARDHEAVAAELRAALDQLLLRGAAAAEPAAAPAVVVEGFGESDDDGKPAFPAPADDDAQSSCCRFDAAAKDTKWACRACGGREASVLLLPCRHLCLCKACEPRTDACPACLAVKNASIHVAPN